ncbi:hypothetical protein M514_16121 [Trichuris suis]|uniref:C2H2-type domain-containing protein n=1 Tax=Trichuris suis TaxID=68888 RepID=A0A085NQ55_9BILA|nr:hypothetical protein M514_16121 [Trichuris suis]
MNGEPGSFVSQPKKPKANHSAIKKHCKVCKVEFKSSRSFHEHLRCIHGVERPYVCQVCRKCFPYASSLYNHLKIHSPDRPFICKFCGSTFRWKFSLKCHLHCAHFKSPSASRSSRSNEGVRSTVLSIKPVLNGKVQAFYSKNGPMENGALAKPFKTDRKANLVTTIAASAVGKHLANVNGIPRKSRIRFFSLDGTSTNHLQLVSSSLAETRKVSSASVVASLPCMNNIDPIPSFRINPALDAVKKVKIEEEYPSVCQSLQANDGVCSSVGSVKLELSGKTLYANNYRMENGGKNGALSKVDSNTSGRLLERVVSRLRTLRSERMSDVSVASEVYFNMPKASLDKSTQTEYACPVCSGLGRGLEQTSQNVSLK